MTNPYQVKKLNFIHRCVPVLWGIRRTLSIVPTSCNYSSYFSIMRNQSCYIFLQQKKQIGLEQKVVDLTCTVYILYMYICRLVEVLNDFSVMDWQLAGLVCQVLWNYSTNIRSSNQTFGEQESQALITLLNDYIGELCKRYDRVPRGLSK